MATMVKVADPKPARPTAEFEAMLARLERHAIRLSGKITDPSQVPSSMSTYINPGSRVRQYG